MASRPSTYTWKRQQNKPIFSSRGNVQEWVKQVQRACDDASKDIFGDNARELLERRDLYVDDDAVLEGQGLIDKWIRKKNVDDLLAECEIQDDISGTSLSFYNNEVSREQNPHVFYSSCDHYQENEDEVQKPVFELDDDFDEESAVHEVVYNMLERDVVNLNSINDESKFKTKRKIIEDPTTKMKLRHEQVRKRANERKVAWEKANVKKMNKRTVEEEARKQLQREEKQRQDSVKREEEEIRKEMVKIRRVMQEENVLRNKYYARETNCEENVKKLAKKEVEKHQELNQERLKRENEVKESMKKKLLKQQEKNEKRKQDNLKLLQSCFSSWYTLVVNKQIKCGKAHALLEWRRKLRIWNAWRTYVLRSRSDRETRALNEEMKERHRKEVLADRFYCQMLFHRCLSAWLSWVENVKEERTLKEQHDKRAEKMATLLEAASSGQLWQDKKTENDCESERDAHASQDLEEISSKPFKLLDLPRNSSFPSRNMTKNENSQRHAWPHQTLKEMKSRRPVKKQNALLENLGSLTARTESSITTIKNSKPRNKDSPSSNSSEKKMIALPKNKNVNMHTQNIHLGDVPNEASSESDQVVVDTRRNIAQEKNVCKDSVSTKNQNVISEGSGQPPSSRSMSSAASKSNVPSRKPPTKPLHLAMDERAKARAERKSLLDAKKRAAEEEKLAKLKQEQEEKEREILAEKHAASERKRQEIKLAKQRELEKQQRLDKLRELNRKADEHYQKTLLNNFGVQPWKKLIRVREEMMNNAEMLYKRKLQSACFREWLVYTKLESQRRHQLADIMHKTALLRFGWQSWKKYRNHLVEMDKVASEFSRRFIVRKYIRIWQDFAIEERLLYWDKENRADEHKEKRLLRKAMIYWKKYIPLLREEERREKRRNNLRKHVTSLLPDFQALHHSP